MKQEKIKIKEDIRKIDGLKGLLNTVLPLVDKVYQEFKNLPYYDEKYSLNEIVNGTEKIRNDYKEAELKKEFSLKKLRLNLRAMMNLTEVPAAPEFDTALMRLNEYSYDLRYFQINKYKVEINRDEIQKFVDKHTLYAETKPEQAIYKALQKLETALEAANSTLAHYAREPLLNHATPVKIDKIFEYSREGLSLKTRYLEGLYLKLKKMEARRPVKELV